MPSKPPEIELTDLTTLQKSKPTPRTDAFLNDLGIKLHKKIINFEAVEKISEDIIDLLGTYGENTITYDVKDKVLCSVTLTLTMNFVNQIDNIIDRLRKEGTTITDIFYNVLQAFGLTLVIVQCVIPENSNFLSQQRRAQFAQFIIDQKMFVLHDPNLKISTEIQQIYDAAADYYQRLVGGKKKKKTIKKKLKYRKYIYRKRKRSTRKR